MRRDALNASVEDGSGRFGWGCYGGTWRRYLSNLSPRTKVRLTMNEMEQSFVRTSMNVAT
jgi:hypothetical protein